MIQKHNRIRLNRYTILSLAILIVAGVSVIAVIQHSHTNAAPVVKPAVAVGAAVPSQFKFTGATDWWQGATSKTDMALFHKVQDSCFVSIQYKMGSVDPLIEIQKTRASLSDQGYTVTPAAIQTLTVQTATGPRGYKLYQSSVTTPAGANTVLGGQEAGYVQLSSNDYLYVQGNCETLNELTATIPALQAIKFYPAKA